MIVFVRWSNNLVKEAVKRVFKHYYCLLFVGPTGCLVLFMINAKGYDELQQQRENVAIVIE